LNIITINNLGDGINVKNDPSAISDGSVVDCVGFELSKEGVLETCQGLADNDISSKLPGSGVQCFHKCYIGSTLYVLATTIDGLYSNGSLVLSGFTGRFKTVSFLNNIFLTNGVLSKRFDGTTCYNWGITVPTTVPTIATGSLLTKTIDAFDTSAVWATNQVNCTISRSLTGSDLVTNGTFTGSGAGWTFDAVDWTYNANAMDKDADGVGTLAQTLAITAGLRYLITLTVTACTVGSFTTTLGGATSTTTVSSNGTYYLSIKTTTTGNLIFTPSDDARFTIDTISVYQVVNKEGAGAINISTAANTTGYSYKPIVVDGTTFSTGDTCTTKDYVSFWLLVDNLLALKSLTFFLDTGDGSFDTDYFSFAISSPGDPTAVQAIGTGRTSSIIPEEGILSTLSDKGINLETFDLFQTESASADVFKVSDNNQIDPFVKNQILSYWKKSTLFHLKSGVWSNIKIPKEKFIQSGDSSKSWSDIVSVKIEVATNKTLAINVKLDDLQFKGGSDLVGDYWFLYTWGREDANRNLIHESGPSRNSSTKQFNIIGPITFDRHPLVYSARPRSADPQVNCGVFYAIGGSLGDFWELFTVHNNSTITDTISAIGDSFVNRKLTSTYNEPAPVGTDIILRRNKIWMVGLVGYPRLFRSSDILLDGTLAPEAWPTRNAYEPENNTGALLRFDIVNKQLVVKGEVGEWSININDPTDFLQISADKVSDKGLIGQDAVISFESSSVYPSNGGFVESNGASASYVMPEVQPLISDGMEDAVGVNAGLVTYFSYYSTLVGNRTAKVDLFRGKPRFSNINDLKLEWLVHDDRTKQVYCIENGSVYILDSGYTNASIPGGELLAFVKSKVYQPGGNVSWNRVQFDHNTGGSWFRLLVYVDEVLKSVHPFRSTSRTKGNFQIGPRSGYGFQFVIVGDYRTLGKIHLPIRIYHGGN
jgi:hypothetical protein